MKHSRPSLFAFQDIITSVIGIFVFISILLMLSISVDTAAIIEEKMEAVEFDKSKSRDELGDLEAINDILKTKRNKMKERKDIYDDISKHIENLKTEIVEIQEEISELDSIKVSDNSTAVLEQFVEAGQARVADLMGDKRALYYQTTKTLEVLVKDMEALNKEIKKFENGAIFINSKNTVGNKNIHFIEAGQKGFTVISKTGLMSLGELELYIYSLDPSSSFLQFIFRPSAAHFYLNVSQFCKDASVQYGITMALEKEAILDE